MNILKAANPTPIFRVMREHIVATVLVVVAVCVVAVVFLSRPFRALFAGLTKLPVVGGALAKADAEAKRRQAEADAKAAARQ